MPQLLYPGNPVAIGIEAALAYYITKPEVIGDVDIFGLNSTTSRLLLIFGITFLYNKYMVKDVDKVINKELDQFGFGNATFFDV